MDFEAILTITLTLFAVIDILGSIPIIVSLRQELGHIHSERITLISAGIMVAFLFVGEEMLKLIGIDVQSFALAGALVIFFVALEMILDRKIFGSGDSKSGQIVPIAFPLIAGAGTLTTLISLRAAYATPDILVALGINLLVVYVVLKLTGKLEKLLGQGGISILRRVFGVVLLAIAIKLVKVNLGTDLPFQ